MEGHFNKERKRQFYQSVNQEVKSRENASETRDLIMHRPFCASHVRDSHLCVRYHFRCRAGEPGPRTRTRTKRTRDPGRAGTGPRSGIIALAAVVLPCPSCGRVIVGAESREKTED